jgi:hypothetical protein
VEVDAHGVGGGSGVLRQLRLLRGRLLSECLRLLVRLDYVAVPLRRVDEERATEVDADRVRPRLPAALSRGVRDVVDVGEGEGCRDDGLGMT